MEESDMPARSALLIQTQHNMNLDLSVFRSPHVSKLLWVCDGMCPSVCFWVLLNASVFLYRQKALRNAEDIYNVKHTHTHTHNCHKHMYECKSV